SRGPTGSPTNRLHDYSAGNAAFPGHEYAWGNFAPGGLSCFHCSSGPIALRQLCLLRRLAAVQVCTGPGWERQAMKYGPLVFLGLLFALALSWLGMVATPQLQLGNQQ